MIKPEFIFFDLGKVILEFSHSRMVQQVAQLAEVPESRVDRVLFGDGLEIQYETGEVDSEQFHRLFCEQAEASCDRDDFLIACSDIFSLAAKTVPVLGQLSQLDIPLGILSNTCEAHWDFVTGRFPILDKTFETIVTSYQSKSMKPDQAIYLAAVEAARLRCPGIQAEQIFFVDDRRENVDGALMAGLDAVLFVDAAMLIDDLTSRGVPLY